MDIAKQSAPVNVVGWREWARLPGLAGQSVVKAKIDTGATTSAIHAEQLELHYGADGQAFASFELFPTSGDGGSVTIERHAVVAFRFVRSSSGHGAYRPVVRTALQLGAQESFDVDITLASRDQMGFRMLLGRAALRGRFHVDPSSSYLQGKPSKPA